MKRASLILAAALLVLGCSAAAEAAPPPSVTVAVYLDQTTALVGQPLNATVTVKNAGAEPFITTRGFMERRFDLDLVFTAPRGGEVRARAAVAAPTPKPPPVHYSNGVPLQVDPVETVPAGWTVAVGPFDVNAFYKLAKPGLWTVRAEFSLGTYPQVTHTIDGAPFAQIDTSDWQGTVTSGLVEVLLQADSDQDGHLYPTQDCDDADPTIPGLVEIIGNGKDDDCNPATLDQPAVPPGTLAVRADRHVVGTGNHPGSAKYPLGNLDVRAFPTGGGSCAARHGTSWQSYKSIWMNCPQPSSQIGRTGADGRVQLTLAPGNYLLLAEYPTSPENVYLGVNAGGIASGGFTEKYLQLIEKSDGKSVPGKYTLKTGSLLFIIEPEYVEWDGTAELYPFIFESVGDWSLKTSIAPPAGFVSNYQYLAERVNSTTEAVQFTIADLGGAWVATGVTHEIRHKGKTVTVKSKIGVKLSKRLAEKKGLDRYGKPIR